MTIGVLKEIKIAEMRVSMTPSGAELAVRRGHRVIVESGAGAGSGFSDQDYRDRGAEIAPGAGSVFAGAELLMHVKEPQTQELPLIRPDHIVFTFLHLAASEELTRGLLKTGAACIAYETVRRADGSLPLLTPMSEVAGRMSIQQAAKYLEMPQGGSGILLGGVPGVAPGAVLVLGGGTVGSNAALMACGLGARVFVLDLDLERIRRLAETMPANCVCLMSSPQAIRELLPEADAVIGAVLIPGAKAPKLVTRGMLSRMKRGSVMVDVAIDQGGCFETSRPTSHADPVFSVDGILHYCVTNMPGAVARTSTAALTNATLPYALEIAEAGWRGAVRSNAETALGLNLAGGRIYCPGVATAFGLECEKDREKL
jgi:alanine dehydrogenase